jgi:hypothetical protein
VLTPCYLLTLCTSCPAWGKYYTVWESQCSEALSPRACLILDIWLGSEGPCGAQWRDAEANEITSHILPSHCSPGSTATAPSVSMFFSEKWGQEQG